MTDWLKNNEPTFMDIREKMHGFFDNVWNVQKRMNKYIHKQGYASFYQVTRNPFLVQQKGTSESQIIMDFEYYLKLWYIALIYVYTGNIFYVGSVYIKSKGVRYE